MRGILPIKPYIWIACLLALTWSTGAAQVARADVRDGAGFFKAETISQANNMILQMEKKYHRDLLVDTIASVPKDKETEATSKDEAVKNRFFADWAAERAGPIGDKRIYLLITRSPLHFQVQVGNQTLNTAFTKTDIRNLRSLLADEFNKKNFDEGLIECVEYVQQTLDRATRPVFSGSSSAPPAPGGGKAADPATNKTAADSEKGTGSELIKWGCIALVALLGIWLVIRLFRSMSGGLGQGPGGRG